ncbi:MAG: hypothetical protein Q9160_005726 [Pyrenula sp. 1 TL-2023]
MEAASRLFFSTPKFAVAGASQDTAKFGYKEISLPSQSYATVSSPSALPSPQQTALSVITPPPVTIKLLQEAKEAGIPAVWLQPGTFDEEVMEYAKANFQAAVGGEGGNGGEGWCVLVDGEDALEGAERTWAAQKL